MQRLLLIGAGHAGAELLRRWAAAPLPEVELTLVSPEPLAPYSGMVPGWLAGDYAWEDCCIDFARLAARAGARLVVDRVVALDAVRREVLLAGGSALTADTMVLNIGSTVRTPAIHDEPSPVLLATRPLGALRRAVDTLVERWRDVPQAPELVGVGGGAAGVETLLALRRRVLRAGRVPRCTLLTRDAELLRGFNATARRLTRAALSGAAVALRGGFDVQAVEPRALRARDGQAQAADLVLWAAGAVAHAWPAASGLDVDAGGFVRVDATLRSTSHPWLFAVGDCAAFDPPLPKAGVYSVRMGPVLAHNVVATLAARELRDYQPQRDQLVLLNTADGRAIASRGRLAAAGRWAMRWKHTIDRRFVERYR
ncbi:MAG: FAD-dependent oxidoreductase [Betaproteobacteria bacterium]|nr:FAD-dependent oxidoreductase [Betaproteobacteria bacterium]MBU6514164.1 FAD-dependent oxidoreductase [Betaproteobacteria bacterium]MDE1956986.1 FAD-dependent oxidoreductase [Betaproteobacteria bacterium]MDE2154182.1 FAD-dependent oxidoreductase [Betaproteobacteria bacterium]